MLSNVAHCGLIRSVLHHVLLKKCSGFDSCLRVGQPSQRGGLGVLDGDFYRTLGGIKELSGLRWLH